MIAFHLIQVEIINSLFIYSHLLKTKELIFYFILLFFFNKEILQYVQVDLHIYPYYDFWGLGLYKCKHINIQLMLESEF